MRKLLLGLLMLGISQLAVAQPPLTLERATQAFNAMQEALPTLKTFDELDFDDIAEEDFSCAGEVEGVHAGLAKLRDTRKDAYDELNRIVGGHGFTNPEEWALTQQRIMNALLANMAEDILASLPADMPEDLRHQMAANFDEAKCATEADKRFLRANEQEFAKLMGQMEIHYEDDF